MKRKRKNPIPILLLWSKKEQLRFSDAVEAFVSSSRKLSEAVDRIIGYEATLAGRTARRRKPAAARPAVEVHPVDHDLLPNGQPIMTIVEDDQAGPDGLAIEGKDGAS